MKDKDFDDIGKRLYDLEAAPPKDGWAKISPVLNGSKPSGKAVWMRKNWWKPLVLLIPASFYMLDPGQGVENSKLLSGPSTDSSIFDPLLKHQVENRSANPGANDFDVREESGRKQERKNSIAGLAKEETAVKRKALVSEQLDSHLAPQNSNISSYIIKVDAQEDNRATDEGISVKQLTTTAIKIASMERGTAHEEIPPAIRHGPVHPLSANMDTTSALRNAGKPVTQEPETTADTTSSKLLAEINETKQDGQWRLTVLFTPQFVVKAIRPIANDEVLMTDIDNSKYPQKIGLGLAVGAGKAITPDFYIDGQLSFMEVQQDIYFSYATGKVDTLVATQQADQTVRVTPVYHVDHREISSKYGYGGVRLGASYYFWSTPKRRFNIAATTGVSYLVSARVKEKIDGQWVSLSNENFNKVNYNFMVGAGYNLNLAKGWELMVNPALTYYLRDVKNEELPYKLNQGSFGLVIMLSKSFERKR